MTVKSILCAYSSDEAKGSGLHHAIRLALHHNAYLTGVLRHGTSFLADRYAAHMPDALLSHIKETDAKLIAEIRQRFENATATAGLLEQSEFVELDPAQDGPLSEFAHGFDLVVTGIHSEGATEAHLSANPDILALKSGRPVLVVPDQYDAEDLADRALVAWDGRRSAARAIGDAMSILAEKSHATLLSVGSKPRGTDRMISNMQRHGIKVDARTVDRSGTIASTILSVAQSDGAKLIVTGAFEHSKFAHDLFGGVTTDIIANAAVPVFMVH